MSHNPRVRPDLAAWMADDTPSADEFNALDDGQFKAVNGDDGGTWAPGAPIIVGGSGVQVTGDFHATSASDVRIPNAGVLDVLAGGVIALENGGQLAGLSGSTTNFQSGSTLFLSGATSIQGASNEIAYGTSRTIRKRGLRLLSSQADDGTMDFTAPPTSPAAWAMVVDNAIAPFPAGGCPVIKTKKKTAAPTGVFFLEIPNLLEGATLASVVVTTVGYDGTPTTFPTFICQRQKLSDLTLANLAAGVTIDAHQAAGTWANDQRDTTITNTTNNVIDSSLYKYWIRCTVPLLAATGSSVFVVDVESVQTVTELRRG